MLTHKRPRRYEEDARHKNSEAVTATGNPFWQHKFSIPADHQDNRVDHRPA